MMCKDLRSLKERPQALKICCGEKHPESLPNQREWLTTAFDVVGQDLVGFFAVEKLHCTRGPKESLTKWVGDLVVSRAQASPSIWHAVPDLWV